MKFTINTSEFGAALSRAQGILEPRSPHSYASQIHLSVGKGKVSISATDTITGLVQRLPAEISKNGSVAVPGRQLGEIVSACEVESLVLSIDESNLRIDTGLDWFNLRMDAADEYPPIPDLDGESQIEIPAQALCTGIGYTLFSVSTDDARTGLNGLALECVTDHGGNPAIRMISTDGHRLSLHEMKAEKAEGFNQVLVSRKGSGELVKALGDFDGLVSIRIVGSSILFKWGESVFVTRLLEGQFPDYKQVLPDTWTRKLRIKRAVLLSGLRKAGILSTNKGNVIAAAFDGNNTLELLASNDTGSSRITVDLESGEGKKIEIGLNAVYLRDSLRKCPGESVSVDLVDPLGPVVIQGDASYPCFVVMPTRLS